MVGAPKFRDPFYSPWGDMGVGRAGFHLEHSGRWRDGLQAGGKGVGRSTQPSQDPQAGQGDNFRLPRSLQRPD